VCHILLFYQKLGDFKSGQIALNKNAPIQIVLSNRGKQLKINATQRND